MPGKIKHIESAIALIVLPTILSACSSGSDSSVTAPNVNPSGNWSLVTTSFQQFDTTGGACLSGSGTMSISGQQISGNFTGSGALNEINGTVDNDGKVVGQFSRNGETIGNVLGSFSNLSGVGTWADVAGCSGDWTATR